LRYRDLVDRQGQTMRDLTRYAGALGDEATRAMIEFRVRVNLWHSLARPGNPGELEPESGGRRMPPEQRRFEEALASATALDRVVAAAARQLREQIRNEERLGLAFSFALGLLALSSVAVLVWFRARLRGLAAVAEERRAEAEWALVEIRRAAESRERLMRGITHDVKNPLGAADGYAELLQMGLRGALEPRHAETVEAIRRSIGSALAMIDDLLELSRAERGELPLLRRDVELGRLVDEVVEAHRGAAEAASLALEVERPESPVVASTDPRRVEQVLSNLVSNAIKYTSSGGRVRVRLDTEIPMDRVAAALITVTDTGPGIPPEDRERIFLEFHRLHPARADGHGLGLAIGRNVARRLGGDLTMDGADGEGARFTFRLPLGQTDPWP
jgi:signal transduction histidine kinase